MGKNSFKKDIRERYRGRGNSWLKVPLDSQIFIDIKEKLKNVNADDYLSDVNEAGFAWARFITPSGTEDDPRVILEVRHQGSKIEQPDCTLDVSYNIASKLEGLGNTPFKLELEKKHIKPKKTPKIKPKLTKKVKKEKFVSEEKKFQEEMEDTIAQTLINIKEAKLDIANSDDLFQWKEFLKAEGLYKNAN